MKLKIEAKHILPLIVDFAKESLVKEDYKVFKSTFKCEGVKEDPLVKAGGLKALLATFLQENKSVMKSFAKAHGLEIEGEKKAGKKRQRDSSSDSSSSSEEKVKKPAAKRARANSNVSTRSMTSAKAKKASSRKSSGEWQPK